MSTPETPAGLLRRAAGLMRKRPAPDYVRGPFWDALADWLESRAGDAGDAIAAPDGTWDMNWCDDPAGIGDALVVARAYLGETPEHPATTGPAISDNERK